MSSWLDKFSEKFDIISKHLLETPIQPSKPNIGLTGSEQDALTYGLVGDKPYQGDCLNITTQRQPKAEDAPNNKPETKIKDDK